MRFAILSLALILTISPRHVTSGAEPPQQAYLLFPIRTGLQRQHLFDLQEKYYLLVHGDSLLDEAGKIDAAKLDFEALSRDLGVVRFVQPGDGVRAHVIFAKPVPDTTKRFLTLAVAGWAREYGFDRHVPSTIGGDRDWQAAIKLTDDARGLWDEGLDENVVGDDSVKAYPVRTKLSKLLTDSADCVVLFPKPFDAESTGKLDEATQAKVKDLVADLKLKDLKRIQFGIWMNDDANKEAVELFDRTTARELARSMGVQNYGVLRAHAR